MSRLTTARALVTLTLATGVYLHLSRLVFGIDLTHERLLTTAFDSGFAVLLVVTTTAVLLARRAVRIRHRRDGMLLYGTLGYLAASVPLHARTWFVPENTEVFRAFPWWYSILFLALSALLLVGWWDLRQAEAAEAAEPAATGGAA